MNREEEIVHYLILHYLENQINPEIFEQLKNEIESRIPTIETLTSTYKSYERFKRIYPDISKSILKQICAREQENVFVGETQKVINHQPFLSALQKIQFGIQFDENEILSFQSLNYYRLTNIIGHIKSIQKVIFDMTNFVMITASEDNLIKLWNLIDGKLIATLRGHTKGIEDMDLSYDKQYLISCGNDGRCIIWNYPERRIVKSIVLNTKKQKAIRFFPNRYNFVLMEKDNIDHIFDERFAYVGNIDAFWETRKTFDNGCFTRNGNQFATTNGDIVLFTVYPTLERNGCLYRSKDSMTFLTQMKSEDIFVCGNSQKIVLCDFTDDIRVLGFKKQKTSGEHFHMLEYEGEELKERIEIARLTEDRKYLIIGFSEGTLLMYKVMNEKMTKFSLFGEAKKVHTEQILSIEIHPIQLNIFVTSASDGQVIIWEIKENTFIPIVYFTRDDYTDKELKSLVINSVYFSPDGHYLCVTDELGSFTLLGIGSEAYRSYQWTPSQQFFRTDYDRLKYDSAGNCFDANTIKEPHLMESGPLCDISKNPYTSLQHILQTNNRVYMQCIENRYTNETYKYRDDPMVSIIENMPNEDEMEEEEEEENDIPQDTPDEVDEPTFDLGENDDVTTHHHRMTRHIARERGIVIRDASEMQIQPPINENQQVRVLAEIMDIDNDSTSIDSREDDEERENENQSEEESDDEMEMEEEDDDELNQFDIDNENDDDENTMRISDIIDNHTELLKEMMSVYPLWIKNVINEYNMTCTKKHKIYFPNIGDIVYYVPSFHEQYLRYYPDNISGYDNMDYIYNDCWIEGEIIQVRINHDKASNQLYTSIDMKVLNENDFIIIENIVFTHSKTPFILLQDYVEYTIQYLEENKRIKYNGRQYRIIESETNIKAYKGIKLNTTNLDNPRISIYEIESEYQYHRNDEFVDYIRDILLEKLNEILESDNYIIFKDPVDVRSYPAYLSYCPFPIDLKIIYQRLLNDEYYRTYSQVEWELIKMIENAIVFNGTTSIYGKEALKLFDEMKDTFEACRSLCENEWWCDLDDKLIELQEYTIEQKPKRRQRKQKQSKEIKETKEKPSRRRRRQESEQEESENNEDNEEIYQQEDESDENDMEIEEKSSRKMKTRQYPKRNRKEIIEEEEEIKEKPQRKIRTRHQSNRNIIEEEEIEEEYQETSEENEEVYQPPEEENIIIPIRKRKTRNSLKQQTNIPINKIDSNDNEEEEEESEESNDDNENEEEIEIIQPKKKRRQRKNIYFSSKSKRKPKKKKDLKEEFENNESNEEDNEESKQSNEEESNNETNEEEEEENEIESSEEDDENIEKLEKIDIDDEHPLYETKEDTSNIPIPRFRRKTRGLKIQKQFIE